MRWSFSASGAAALWTPATLGAVTAAAVANRSLEDRGDNAAHLVEAAAIVWILASPALSWYDCGWWIEWRKVSGYILFFSWVICFLSILDFGSTEVEHARHLLVGHEVQ